MLILLTAIGAACGGMLRYLMATLAARFVGEGFPWGTLAANASGSLGLGLLLGAGGAEQAGWLAGDAAQVFFGVGVCGGLTTFSTFSLQTLTLVSKGDWPRVAGNVVGGTGLCVLLVAAGFLLGEGWAA